MDTFSLWALFTLVCVVIGFTGMTFLGMKDLPKGDPSIDQQNQ